MKGVRVIEVAEYAFVPASAGLLADWGAEVIKIEPVERGDAGRGISDIGPSGVQVRFHNVNRGKKSLALDLAQPEGREILYKLVKTADIFLTNKQPRVRRKLEIDVEHIRAHNPNIIYVRGTGQGPRGPEAERGSYDLLNFWHRSGASSAVMSPRGEIPFLPAPGFGDLMGAMFIAGGMMGALYHRAQTGEAPIVDASLLATGMWAMAGSGATAATEGTYSWPPPIKNPLSSIYPTSDGRHVALSCLQAGRYWAPLCEVAGRPDLAVDPRFANHAAIMENSAAAIEILTEVFSARPLEEWRRRLAEFSGQWAVVQDVLQVVNDQQALANGYVQDVETLDGKPFKLVAAPIQYDGQAAKPRPGPAFNEHGDEILAELGIDVDTLIDLKVRGVLA
jgi:crotonobetainyl-CoA:carnitine CoA-transferase CaiB-like acyl-CoA transferase